MGSKPKGMAGLNQKVPSESSLSPPGSLSGLCLLFWTLLWPLPAQEPSIASTIPPLAHFAGPVLSLETLSSPQVSLVFPSRLTLPGGGVWLLPHQHYSSHLTAFVCHLPALPETLRGPGYLSHFPLSARAARPSSGQRR